MITGSILVPAVIAEWSELKNVLRLSFSMNITMATRQREIEASVVHLCEAE